MIAATSMPRLQRDDTDDDDVTPPSSQNTERQQPIDSSRGAEPRPASESSGADALPWSVSNSSDDRASVVTTSPIDALQRPRVVAALSPCVFTVTVGESPGVYRSPPRPQTPEPPRDGSSHGHLMFEL
jgi:hypothetical protein